MVRVTMFEVNGLKWNYLKIVIEIKYGMMMMMVVVVVVAEVTMREDVIF